MNNTTYNLKNKPQPIQYATPMDRKPDLRALWVGLGALVIILPLIFFSGTLIFFQVRQLNLPNVFVLDQHVGMISRDETATLVDEIYNQNRQVSLIDPANSGNTIQISAEELGLWVDPQATADAAFAIGRSADPYTDLTLAFSGESHVVIPVFYYNEQQARTMLESIASEQYIAPIEASLRFKDGEWIALPGVDGRVMNLDKTLDALLSNAFAIFMQGKAPLQLQTVQPKVADFTPLLAQIDTLIAQEYNLMAYDPIADQAFSWSVPAEVQLSWITVDEETLEAVQSIRPEDVEALLSTWSLELGDDMSFDPELKAQSIVEAWQAGEAPVITIQYDPTQYLVSQGESLWSISLKLGMPMWFIIDANPGLSVNNLSAGMTLDIPSRNVLLPLPAVPNKRIVISISEQRMYVYENGAIRNTHIVSTGVSDSPTMAGIFQIQSHELNAYASNWDLYMPHFLGIYEAWPGFMNGIHGLPLLSSGNRLWASNLGSPASFGCIILDLDAAEDLFYWADAGVVVEIVN